MVDVDIPDPMTQSTTQQEPNPSMRDAPPSRSPWPPDEGDFGPTDEGYETGDAGEYPVLSPDNAPIRNAEGLPLYYGTSMPPSTPQNAIGQYKNEDYAAIDRWVQEVQARGNEIRKTAVGTFEVEAGTNNIVSQMPSPYPVN